MSGAKRVRPDMSEEGNHERRAAELLDERDIRTISNSLQDKTWAIRHVNSKLKLLGIDLNQYAPTHKKQRQSTQPLPASSKTLGLISKKHTEEDKPKAILEGVTDEKGVPVPNHLQIPSKYWNLEAMTPKYLSEFVLPELETSTFSTPNCKQMIKRGQAQDAHETFLETIEFVSGKDRIHWRLLGPLRIHAVLIRELTDAMLSRGRRGRDLAFPDRPVWGRDGVYGLKEEGLHVLAYHRFVKGSPVDITESLKQAKVEYSVFASLFLDRNFSEANASVKSREANANQELKLYTFFVEADDHGAAHD